MSPDDLYREHVLDHYKNPRNYGRLEGADAVSKEENQSCGDEVTFYLKVTGDRLTSVRFTSMSCAICTASASMLTELACGKELSEAAALGRNDILGFFGGPIDPARERCAFLPMAALKSALSKVMKDERLQRQ